MPNWKSLYPLRPQSPRWDGKPYPKAVILIHDEQGLGDTLQFVRYMPLVKERCAKTILETRKELVSLLAGVPGIDEIVIRPDRASMQAPCDFHMPLMSLPGLFQTTPETIPGGVPYLQADSEKSEAWSSSLPSDGLRVGLVWAGRPQHTNDKNRSCRLADLMPLLTLEDTIFVSLQKGPASEQLKELPKEVSVLDINQQLQDFSDTAAVVTNLDVVVTVDTAMAHLAGAMGKQAFLLVPFIPDWRWGARRLDSPWYPSMRLFRQSKPNEWPAVVSRVHKALFDLCCQYGKKKQEQVNT
jgi:hypothetical protein